MKDSLKNVKYIEKDKILDFIKVLQKDYTVIAPKKVKDFVLFGELKDNEEPYLDFLNSRKSPKEFYFPQTETIVEYEGIIDKRVPKFSENDMKKRIIFGIRPCDVKSTLILDKLFVNEDYIDDYYKRLRDNTLIFSFGCNNPKTTCFCASFECGPFSEEGSDAFITDIGDKFIIEGITEQGNKIIDKLPDGDGGMLKKKKEIKKNSDNVVSCIENIQKIPEKLRGMFENPVWEEISERCLGCGVCTYLCPTCHCFDIQDEMIGEDGRRVKNWDSCMFPIFTLHGSGHQPREFRFQRMRQRIMHKFNYYEENFNIIACSGCGRCVTECPVNIDVREILEKIKQL
ncbi:4Fe-4S dicluster domain-containing protein [candidate division WOR-3 bacterium]|nr:4Fe-4S dicluster domain-containing protein [candidate division WOR-3 bacterium]